MSETVLVNTRAHAVNLCAQELERRRHLMRLWVSPPNERPLPEQYVELWGSTTPGHRGGIYIGQARMTVPLEAE